MTAAVRRSHPRFHPAPGHDGEVIDLQRWQLNDLPDDSSDEDRDDDRELLDPDGLVLDTWREAFPSGPADPPAT